VIMSSTYVSFFFQAEDGIRDFHVTGVQTCALPILSFNELRQQYDYLSVVYLQNGCQPCYPKYIEWHESLDSMKVGDSYTVLFVIAGQNYSDFMAKVLER